MRVNNDDGYATQGTASRYRWLSVDGKRHRIQLVSARPRRLLLSEAKRPGSHRRHVQFNAGRLSFAGAQSPQWIRKAADHRDFDCRSHRPRAWRDQLLFDGQISPLTQLAARGAVDRLLNWSTVTRWRLYKCAQTVIVSDVAIRFSYCSSPCCYRSVPAEQWPRRPPSHIRDV